MVVKNMAHERFVTALDDHFMDDLLLALETGMYAEHFENEFTQN